MSFNRRRNMHLLSRPYYWDNNIKTIKSLGGNYTAHYYFFRKSLLARLRHNCVRMLGRYAESERLSIKWLTITHNSYKRKTLSVPISEISVKDDKDVFELEFLE